MHSIKEIFRIGRGPSSSHTMGPEKACRSALRLFPDAESLTVTLQGSLAKTGRGHRTDYVIEKTLGAKFGGIIWDTETTDLPHPNTLKFAACKEGKLMGEATYLSIGGGAIQKLGEDAESSRDVYPVNTWAEIAEASKGMTLPEFVYKYEGEGIRLHLYNVWQQMCVTIQRGLTQEGVLPGGLFVKRRAKELWQAATRDRNLIKKEHFMMAAFAYSTCEENAAGETMVTAPTCGASGVLPAVLYYEHKLFGLNDEEIVDALAVAGLIGCVIKKNASVSGAECGCQAEIGSACAMAAGALAYAHGLNISQIESAAEIAMEHCLGLTCDPVGGLVQIPCIERNATGALRAYDAASLAEVISDNRKISFDLVVRTMYETGKDLSTCYRETADGGLAKLYVKDFY